MDSAPLGRNDAWSFSTTVASLPLAGPATPPTTATQNTTSSAAMILGLTMFPSTAR